MADIEEIKKRLDIVAIIGEYLTLKKSGVTYKALCPFHPEKTPSFTVSAERQSWHCFGCNEGGDVLAFVQKIDGLDFREALERLATRAGVEIDTVSPRDIANKTERTAISGVLDMAAALFHELLLHHPYAAEARQYLTTRGVSNESIEQFKLGYAPNAWHTIDSLISKKKLVADLAWKSGLSVQKSGSQIYDRFRNRLMFPIQDASGAMIGFTGRALADEENQPKYLNTSESVVFKKGQAIYGLHLARQAIRESKRVVLVEGQMDVITAHQYGFSNTVATSGTALTEDHLRLLKRYTDTVVFAFDGDDAGQKTARSAVSMAFAQDLNPFIVNIPTGKDPDDAIRADSNLWVRAVAEAKPAIEYWIDKELERYPNPSAVDKKAIAAAIVPLIRLVHDTVEQAEYVHNLATRLNVPDQSILTPATVIQPKQSNTSTDQPAEKPDLERQFIGLCLVYPTHLPELPQLRFENEALGSIYAELAKHKPPQSTEKTISALPKAWLAKLNVLIIETLRRHELLDEEDIYTEIRDCLKRIQVRDRETRIATHARAIADAFSSGNRDKARSLLKSLDSDTINQD